MPRWFVIVAAIAIVAGIVFRFDRLGAKLYTNDEATTSVHVSGHTIAQYLEAADAGRIQTVADALAYQKVDPKTGYRDVVATLAVEDPQHPPLFYVLERAAQEALGDDIASRRVLPAAIGTLAIGCAFWFGLTLLGSRTAALAAAALVATSPFHHLYAQQAREYGLWTALVLVASALLVLALRGASRATWFAYALALALGLYADLLFVYTIVAHALFVAIAHRRRTALVPFASAVVAAIAAFAPWIVVLVRGRTLVTNNAYLGTPLAPKLFALKWIFNAGAVFYDYDYAAHATVLVLPFVFAIVAWGIVAFARRANADARALVFALAGTTLVAMLVPDVLRHESRSTASRYLVPLWLGIEFALAHAFGTWLRDARTIVRAGGLAAFATIVAFGLGSIAYSVGKEAWWGDGGIAPIGPIARVVRAAPKPVRVVFADDHVTWDFSPVLLADEVAPDVGLVLLRRGEALPHDTHGATLYALDPTAAFRAALARAGWREDVAYVATTSDAQTAALRREARDQRASVGYVEEPASLWRLR